MGLQTAADILNAAFESMVRNDDESNFVLDEHYQYTYDPVWEPGEAEEFLQKILSGDYYLDISINNGNSSYSPCLRAA